MTEVLNLLKDIARLPRKKDQRTKCLLSIKLNSQSNQLSVDSAVLQTQLSENTNGMQTTANYSLFSNLMYYQDILNNWVSNWSGVTRTSMASQLKFFKVSNPIKIELVRQSLPNVLFKEYSCYSSKLFFSKQLLAAFDQLCSWVNIIH